MQRCAVEFLRVMQIKFFFTLNCLFGFPLPSWKDVKYENSLAIPNYLPWNGLDGRTANEKVEPTISLKILFVTTTTECLR